MCPPEMSGVWGLALGRVLHGSGPLWSFWDAIKELPVGLKAGAAPPCVEVPKWTCLAETKAEGQRPMWAQEATGSQEMRAFTLQAGAG